MSLRAVHTEERLLTRLELAGLLGCSPDTVDEMRKKGLPTIRWGRKLVRFRASAAIGWLEDQDGVA